MEPDLDIRPIGAPFGGNCIEGTRGKEASLGGILAKVWRVGMMLSDHAARWGGRMGGWIELTIASVGPV